MVGLYLFFAVFVGGADGDLAAAGVDQDIHWIGKRWPLLNAVIADELEGVALREYGGFIVNGSVFEMEEGFRGDAVAVDDLDDVS
jgi:hypothetical protein